MSVLDLQTWSQNGDSCWVMWTSSLSTQPMECPSFKEVPSLCALLHKLPHHTLADMPRPGHWSSPGLPFEGVRVGHHYPCPRLVIHSLVRAAGSWWVSALFWNFLSSGTHLFTMKLCSAAEHTYTQADCLDHFNYFQTIETGQYITSVISSNPTGRLSHPGNINYNWCSSMQVHFLWKADEGDKAESPISINQASQKEKWQA